MDIDKNPFCIPDLTLMYEKVRDFIRNNQGEKGFICTHNPQCDTIFTIIYDGCSYEVNEYTIKAVRVNDYNRIQILFDTFNTVYTEEIISDMMNDNEDWYDVQYDDAVYYIPTIFNIAEYIREYV